jgi:hypothetical protein
MAQRGNNSGDGRWLLIIGATGQTGGRVLRGALDRGWRVTALVRTPTKLPDDVRGDPRVTVCTGSLTDAGAVEAALRCCSAVFVAAVDYMRAKEHPLTNFVAALPGAMRRNGAGRLVFQSGALAAIPGEELRGRRWFLRNSFAKWFGYEEQVGVGRGVLAAALTRQVCCRWPCVCCPTRAMPRRTGGSVAARHCMTAKRAHVCACVV